MGNSYHVRPIASCIRALVRTNVASGQLLADIWQVFISPQTQGGTKVSNERHGAACPHLQHLVFVGADRIDAS